MKTLLSASLAIGFASASTIALCPAQAQLIQIADSAGGATAYTAGSSLHRMAVDGDGNLYAVMKRGAPLVLYRSTDGGATWAQVASDSTGGNPSGQGIVGGPECDFLHVGFHARLGMNRETPMYRKFNTKTLQWAGPAEVVYNGATATQDFRFADIEVTQKGTIVVAFKTPSAAPAPFKNSAGMICVKKAGSTTWSAPIQVSTGGNGSGLRNQLHAIGEVVHCCFRYSSGGHNVTVRSYDTEASAWVGPQVVVDGPKASTPSPQITNYMTSAIDDNGRMYVMYGVGDVTLTTLGEYKLAYADAPYTSWTTMTVAKDPAVLGRTDTKHISLVNTTDDQIICMYSKKTAPESLDKLYARELVNGTLTAERVVATRTANFFQTIWGHRSVHSGTGFIGFVHDESNGSAARVMWYLNDSGKAGRTRHFGNSCAGNRTELPILSTNRAPEAGRFAPIFTINHKKMPPNSAGALFIGINCLATPIDLGAIGAGGCSVIMDPMLNLGGFATNAMGENAIPLQIPAQFAGASFRFQSFILAPGANSAGFLLTQGLTIQP